MHKNKKKPIANNRNENRSRQPHHYKPGDKVLLTDSRRNRSKMSTPRNGPYEIVRVNTNGTVRIRKGAVEDTINLRRITPYFEASAIWEASAI